MTVSYAAAQDLLDALVSARTRADGDAFVALFAEEGTFAVDPFEPALAGHNALRAYLLDAAAEQRHFDLAIERHWVAGDTVLAAWHGSWDEASDGRKVRAAGFLVAELGGDALIQRLRLWSVAREHGAD